MAQGEVIHAIGLPRHYIVLPGLGGTMWLRRIPAGEFIIGSRCWDDELDNDLIAACQPEYRVVIGTPFWMAERTLTQAQLAVWTESLAYRAWREACGQEEEHANWFVGQPDCPAERVTWPEAKGYCEWLTRAAAASLPLGHVASLPTES